MTKSSTKALQIYNFRALPYFNNSDGDGDGVGGAVLRVFHCGTYATKTVTLKINLLSANNFLKFFDYLLWRKC